MIKYSDFFFSLPRYVTCLSELPWRAKGFTEGVYQRLPVGVLVAVRLNTLVSIASNLKVASMTRDGAYTHML
jgi:hypothetical protein